MFRNSKQHKRGFTLIELIVVLAILAIVAAIAVPTAFHSIEKARTAACASSMSNLASKMQHDAVLSAINKGLVSESEANAIMQDVVQDCGGTVASNGAVTGFCPSGGTYTITYSTDTGLFAITCSKHSAESTGGYMSPVGDNNIPFLVDIIKNLNLSGQSIDSTAYGTKGQYIDTIKAELENQGISLADYGMTSWQYINNYNGYQLLWTTEDISTRTVGETIPVLCYNNAYGTYTVWNATVESKKQDAGTYNVLKKTTVLYGTSTPGSDGICKDYESALAAYQALQSGT